MSLGILALGFKTLYIGLMKDPKPTVTVVIPTYNRSHLLKKAIQSVISQTFENWELVVINNFSEDDTLEVIKGFKDPRIRVINFRNFGSIAASRNQGAIHASAELVAYLDSDDAWYPKKLEICLNQMTEDVDFVSHGVCLVEENGARKSYYTGPLDRAKLETLVFKGHCFSTSACVLRKKKLDEVGGWNEDIGIVTSEDYDLWVRLTHAKTKFKFVHEVLGDYGIHSGNESSKVKVQFDSSLKVIRKSFHLIENQSFLNKLKLQWRISVVRFSVMKLFIKQADWGSGIRQGMLAILPTEFLAK